MTAVEAEHLNDPVYWDLLKIIQRKYPSYDLEIRGGEYVIVSPHDLMSANVAIRIGELFNQWVRPRKLGHCFDSNGGFKFPDGDMMAPDFTYVSRERLPVVPRSFAAVVPELVVEVRSSSQIKAATRNKLASLVAKGADVGVYVDPLHRVVEIHRAGAEPIILGDGDRFEVPDVLPGFGFVVDELWPE